MFNLTEKIRSFQYEPKVTLGNIITIVTLLLAGCAGYVELRTNHNNLAGNFGAHEAYDDRRFETLATKEARSVRDQWLDDKLAEILQRVKRIEDLHTK